MGNAELLDDFLEGSDTVVSIPEIFTYWLQGGRITGDFPIAEASIKTIGRLMAGGEQGEQARPQDGAAA
jgi:hypothetical protein